MSAGQQACRIGGGAGYDITDAAVKLEILEDLKTRMGVLPDAKRSRLTKACCNRWSLDAEPGQCQTCDSRAGTDDVCFVQTTGRRMVLFLTKIGCTETSVLVDAGAPPFAAQTRFRAKPSPAQSPAPRDVYATGPRVTVVHLRFAARLYDGTAFKCELLDRTLWIDDLLATVSHKEGAPGRGHLDRLFELRGIMDTEYVSEPALGMTARAKSFFVAYPLSRGGDGSPERGGRAALAGFSAAAAGGCAPGPSCVRGVCVRSSGQTVCGKGFSMPRMDRFYPASPTSQPRQAQAGAGAERPAGRLDGRVMRLTRAAGPDGYQVSDEAGNACGLLAVPDMAVSKELRDAFAQTGSAKWRCYFHAFRRWAPCPGGMVV